MREEVEACARPEQMSFTPDQVLARVDHYGDLLADLLDPALAAELP